MSKTKTNEGIEKVFMDFLAETKVWSLPIIDGETAEIKRICPWFSELIKVTFVAHTMVLLSAQLNRQNAPSGRVPLNIPSCPVFVQALYTNVATAFFNHPNVFRTRGLTSDQMIDNRNMAYNEIRGAIDATVRSLIPFPQIIQASLNFVGNNPVITARPAPPAQQQQQRPPGSGRKSDRLPATMQTAQPPQPPPLASKGQSSGAKRANVALGNEELGKTDAASPYGKWQNQSSN